MSRSITRNESGFSALPVGHPLENLDVGNPFKWSTFFDDFLAYDKTQLIGGNPYTFTVTNACVDTISGATGVLDLTLGGSDNDAGSLFLVDAPFQMSSTKRAYFQSRFKLNLVGSGTLADSEIFIGLSSLEAPFAADGLSLAGDDMLGFYTLDLETTMSVTMRENDVGSTEATALTPTDNDWFTVGIFYDGRQAKFYTSAANNDNMTLAATLTTTDVTSVVSPHIFIKAGSADANVFSVDYTFTAIER